MGPLDALWHLLNFFFPALGVGAVAAALAKALWRRDLAGVSYLRLVAFGSVSNALVLIAGLVLAGRDGRMLTYAAMVIVCAASLMWAGWGPGRR